MTAKFIKLYDENPNPKQIAIIKEVLQNGGLIIFPTDTVYGIGCDLNSPKGLKSLAQLKGVKIDKANFSFITDSLSNLSEYVSALNTPVFKLLKRTLPGPYTYILNGSSKLPKPFKNKRTVGIRIPDNNIVRAIVKALGNPLAVSSLKDSDEIVEYSTDPELIFENWQHKVAVVIDGGYGGLVPSTVIDCIQGEPVLVRQGKGEV
ncbi:MAG: threonylcarbamoyl-AMP synthase [Flavobacteriia bacterium]|nr:MAG: threonylcarbamoyl-AMP synthase [Flavobacteriia bacterium]